MQTIKYPTAVIAALALLAPAVGSAETRGPEPLFDVIPVSDQALSRARGGQALWGYSLTGNDLRVISIDQSRTEFLGTAAIGTLIMNQWWSEIGAPLIATNQLAAQQGR